MFGAHDLFPHHEWAHETLGQDAQDSLQSYFHLHLAQSIGYLARVTGASGGAWMYVPNYIKLLQTTSETSGDGLDHPYKEATAFLRNHVIGHWLYPASGISLLLIPG